MSQGSSSPWKSRMPRRPRSWLDQEQCPQSRLFHKFAIITPWLQNQLGWIHDSQLVAPPLETSRWTSLGMFYNANKDQENLSYHLWLWQHLYQMRKPKTWCHLHLEAGFKILARTQVTFGLYRGEQSMPDNYFFWCRAGFLLCATSHDCFYLLWYFIGLVMLQLLLILTFVFHMP